MENDVKQIIRSCGADVCGIAGIEGFSEAPAGFSPSDIFETCKSVVVFGIAIPRGLTKVDSRLIYGHYLSVIYQEADRIALRGAKALERKFGANAVPMPCDNPYEYWEPETMTGKGLISMKHAAVASGLSVSENCFLPAVRHTLWEIWAK